MGGLRSAVTSMLLILLMVACSPSKEVTQAPQSQDEAGIIIQGTSSQVQTVLSQSSEYRLLNKEQNLYEVKGMNLEQVHALAPQITAEKNFYFDNLVSSSRKSKQLESVYTKLTMDEAPQPSQKLPPALKDCDLSIQEKPTATLSLTSDVLSQSRTINLSETPGFSGIQSTPHKDHDSALEFRWDVLAPSLSSIPQQDKKGETFEFTPDSVGMYQIILVAKDDRNACDVFVGRFLVTDNPDVEFARDDEERPAIDLKHFTHLAKVEAQKAWETATGKGIKIAVLDTGVQYNHPAIKFNLAVNEQEKSGEVGSDDDNNGFSDDTLGWDFINGDNKPFDDEGHGSHVSGLAASHLIGTAKDATVIPVKVLNAAGGGDLASIVAGIYYAVDNGAQVINASLGGAFPEFQAMLEAVEYANSKGVVFIAAAGNDNLDLSLPQNNTWPAEFDIENVVSVAATGINNALASYSNFGKEETDVAAPGGDAGEPVYSLATVNTHGAQFVGSGGTSMASPIVAGIAALLLETNPSLTPAEVKKALMDGGKDVQALDDVVGSGKLLNAPAALELVSLDASLQ